MTSDDQVPDREPVDLTPTAIFFETLAGGSSADPAWVIDQRAPTDADRARAIGLETRTQESQ